jgi:hypothetical protein
MDFESNRQYNKKFKAIIATDKMVSMKKDTETIVSYFGEHHNYHMWRDEKQTYLAYYEHQIYLLEEIQAKVA